MKVAPITVRRACIFVAEVHRKLPKVQGGMWAIGVEERGELVGVAIVGHPARVWNELGILSVLRVAVREGFYNACSMLYGACSRAAKAMGASALVTYTHLDESGASLRAANWIAGGLTDGGEHDRPSRPRQAALFPEPKRRWWAPWSSIPSTVTVEEAPGG